MRVQFAPLEGEAAAYDRRIAPDLILLDPTVEPHKAVLLIAIFAECDAATARRLYEAACPACPAASQVPRQLRRYAAVAVPLLLTAGLSGISNARHHPTTDAAAQRKQPCAVQVDRHADLRRATQATEMTGPW